MLRGQMKRFKNVLKPAMKRCEIDANTWNPGLDRVRIGDQSNQMILGGFSRQAIVARNQGDEKGANRSQNAILPSSADKCRHCEKMCRVKIDLCIYELTKLSMETSSSFLECP